MSNIINYKKLYDFKGWDRSAEGFDYYDYISLHLGRENYIYIRLKTGKVIRLFDPCKLETEMYKSKYILDETWESYYERKIEDRLCKILDKLESDKEIELTEDEQDNYFLNDIVFGECKQYIAGLYSGVEDSVYDATPDDWYWDILPTEIKERANNERLEIL